MDTEKNDVKSVNNDDKILELKKKVAEKKSCIKKADKFVPVTNCSIEHNGQRYNLQVLQRDKLISLLVELNALKMSAENLNILDEYYISGYRVMDWITDIQMRLANINKKEEEDKLRIMESKLQTLLSNEKKVELELDEITKILGGFNEIYGE